MAPLVHIQRSARSPPGRRRRRRTSSRSRSGGSASSGLTPSGAGHARRRAARRRARRSAGRRRVAGGLLGVSPETWKSSQAPAPPIAAKSSRRRGTTSRPGASSPQRDSDEPHVQRPDIAHELTVLVPAAGDVRGRPCAASTSGRRPRPARRGSPDEPVSPSGRRCRTCRRAHRRVGGEERRRLPRSRAAHRGPGTRVGLELARSSRRGPLAASCAVADLEGLVDLIGEAQRLVAVDHAADQHGAVAQDAGADQSGVSSSGGGRAGRLSRDRLSRPARGTAGLSLGVLDELDPGEVAQAQQPVFFSRSPCSGPLVRRLISRSALVEPSNSPSTGSDSRGLPAVSAMPRRRCRCSSCVERASANLERPFAPPLAGSSVIAAVRPGLRRPSPLRHIGHDNQLAPIARRRRRVTGPISFGRCRVTPSDRRAPVRRPALQADRHPGGDHRAPSRSPPCRRARPARARSRCRGAGRPGRRSTSGRSTIAILWAIRGRTGTPRLRAASPSAGTSTWAKNASLTHIRRRDLRPRVELRR